MFVLVLQFLDNFEEDEEEENNKIFQTLYCVTMTSASRTGSKSSAESSPVQGSEEDANAKASARRVGATDDTFVGVVVCIKLREY